MSDSKELRESVDDSRSSVCYPRIDPIIELAKLDTVFFAADGYTVMSVGGQVHQPQTPEQMVVRLNDAYGALNRVVEAAENVISQANQHGSGYPQYPELSQAIDDLRTVLRPADDY